MPVMLDLSKGIAWTAYLGNRSTCRSNHRILIDIVSPWTFGMSHLKSSAILAPVEPS
jgi:hypothetical protein